MSNKKLKHLETMRCSPLSKGHVRCWGWCSMAVAVLLTALPFHPRPLCAYPERSPDGDETTRTCCPTPDQSPGISGQFVCWPNSPL